MSYMLEVVVDGKATRTSLASMPTSVVVRFYSVVQTEAVTLLAEKVLK
jgi:hypothetical protein